MSTAPPETAEIVLRSARPEDGLQTADLIVSTGETIFRYLFYQERERTVDLVRRLFGLENNEFSHRHIHLAEIGGEIAGLVCFFTREEMAANERTMAWAIIRHLGLLQTLARLPRFLHLDRLTEDVDDRSLYVAHLATAPPYRRRGVATRLLRFCEAAAAERGLYRLALDVDVDNAPAYSLYSRFGFRPHQRFMTRYLERRIGFRGFCRMLKDLSPETEVPWPPRLDAAEGTPKDDPCSAETS